MKNRKKFFYVWWFLNNMFKCLFEHIIFVVNLLICQRAKKYSDTLYFVNAYLVAKMYRINILMTKNKSNALLY